MVTGAVALMVVPGGSLRTGERTNAQGMGMARTQVAVARGIEAVGSNPANLVLLDDAAVDISLLPLGAHVGSNVFSFDLYRDYFRGIPTDSGWVGVTLTETDKTEILDRFAGSIGRGGVDAEAQLFGVAVSLGDEGAVALTITDHLAGSVEVPKEYLEFLFYGNPPGSSYNFRGSQGSIAWTRQYSLSYARPLPRIPPVQEWYAGVTVKLVHGYGYAGTDRFNATLATSQMGVLDGTVDILKRRAGLDPTAEDFGNSITLVPPPAGSGFGVDVGLGGIINEMIRVGLSVTDIGSVSWRRMLRESSTHRTVRLENPFERAERDSLDQALQGESREGSPFTTPLPTTLRLGASVELQNAAWFRNMVPGEMTVAMEFSQGLHHVPGTTLVPRGSLGVEYRAWRFLPLRGGISFGGTDGVNLALGVGFHSAKFDVDLATENLGWIVTPNSAAHGSLAAGMKLRL